MFHDVVIAATDEKLEQVENYPMKRALQKPSGYSEFTGKRRRSVLRPYEKNHLIFR
jgi:hypothetical protein